MTEEQSAHRRDLEMEVVRARSLASIRGQVIGGILVWSVIVGGFVASILEKDLKGYAAVLAAGAYLIWNRRQQQKQDAAELAAKRPGVE